MYCINVHNVNQALAEGLKAIKYHGKERPSRNGKVLVVPQPVTTTYANPGKRVLFSPHRNANPFFHLMEGLWMLAGRNDVAFLAQFNKRMATFSDDGEILHGAYGYRWRQHFGFDQLTEVVKRLRADRTSRQVVLQMWDCEADLGMSSKDIPCNDIVFFDTHGARLNMTVCCRSNDLWWGAYGANAVHFSMLLEYVAAAAEIPMGVYRQMSNNFHLYTDIVNPDDLDMLSASAEDHDLYTVPMGMARRRVENAYAPTTLPLLYHGGAERFLSDLDVFMTDPAATFGSQFLERVAKPMHAAWLAYKVGDFGVAEQHILTMAAKDWAIAAMEWLYRRKMAKLQKEKV